ncbi:hypothetical protein JTS93_08565 [Clostridium botulinum]|nr:hypothetical protein [Clostridium botulinum]
MSRVFENLINNSLKYSLSNTRIYVEIEDIVKGIKSLLKMYPMLPLILTKKKYLKDLLEVISQGPQTLKEVD